MLQYFKTPFRRVTPHLAQCPNCDCITHFSGQLCTCERCSHIGYVPSRHPNRLLQAIMLVGLVGLVLWMGARFGLGV